MTIIACHNCGKKATKKSKGIKIRINVNLAWFHSVQCFKRWNKIYKDKYIKGVAN